MNELVIYDAQSEDFQERAKKYLTENQIVKLNDYIEVGKYQITPETVTNFFELYLNGSEPEEIARLNKGFDLASIHWAMIKYNWPIKKDQYIYDLQEGIRQKVIKAQLEATSLMTDMLTASNKKNSEKLKKYIQTGDEEHLKGVMNIESLNGLLKTIEGLQKITGQDRVHKIETKNTQEVNLNLNTKVNGENADLTPEQSAAVLAIYSGAKRGNQ